MAGCEGEDTWQELSLRLIVRTDAELDITEGFDWYEGQQTGLGHAFFAEISSVLIAVEKEPLRFPVALHPVRRAMAQRFT